MCCSAKFDSWLDRRKTKYQEKCFLFIAYAHHSIVDGNRDRNHHVRRIFLVLVFDVRLDNHHHHHRHNHRNKYLLISSNFSQEHSHHYDQPYETNCQNNQQAISSHSTKPQVVTKRVSMQHTHDLCRVVNKKRNWNDEIFFSSSSFLFSILRFRLNNYFSY